MLPSPPTVLNRKGTAPTSFMMHSKMAVNPSHLNLFTLDIDCWNFNAPVVFGIICRLLEDTVPHLLYSDHVRTCTARCARSNLDHRDNPNILIPPYIIQTDSRTQLRSPTFWTVIVHRF